MSLSSNSRKESTESYAAQRMGNTMGVAPEQSQLAKTDQPGDLLPSESYQTGEIDVRDLQPVDDEPNKVQNEGVNSDTELVEVSDDAVARDDDGGLGDSKWAEDRVPGADWNRDTEETKELGHS
ncbi:hypothetical protein ACFQ4C_06120 [Larkinella insperata]|uniref:Uncharacterized protein n=1 Tax=Larkinella insperata TaxID=332158 RepID=A0ABW3Q1E8_9BACT|nr:hypothetical protein [Larkinella insperata]